MTVMAVIAVIIELSVVAVYLLENRKIRKAQVALAEIQAEIHMELEVRLQKYQQSKQLPTSPNYVGKWRK